MIRFHGEKGAAILEAHNAKRMADGRQNHDTAQTLGENKVDTEYGPTGNHELACEVGGVTSGGSQLLDENSCVTIAPNLNMTAKKHQNQKKQVFSKQHQFDEKE